MYMLYYSTGNSVSSNRMEKVSQFEDWLKKNDVTVNNIKIEDYGEEYGFGVKATSSVKVFEFFNLLKRWTNS